MMESSRNLQSLPEEVVLMIAKLLRAQDLAAWSATSHYWRNLFNRDSCWRQYCNPSLVEYLQVTPCIAKPSFVIPVLEGSDLPPLCDWRLHFMRQNHLWNNWRTGTHSLNREHSTDSSSISFFNISRTYSSQVKFYKEDFAFEVFRSRLQLWDLRGCFAAYTVEPCKTLPKLKICSIEIFGDYLAVLQLNFMQVFLISLMKEKWPLLYTFFVENNKKTPLEVVQSFANLQIFFSESRLYSSFCSYRTLLLQNVYVIVDKHTNIMHIWDIEKGVKLKAVTCEDNKNWAVYSLCSNNGTTVVLGLSNRVYREKRQIKFYDLTKLIFLPFVIDQSGITFNSLYAFEQFVSVSIVKSGLEVYNFKTGEMLLKLQNTVHCQYHNGSLVFIHEKNLKMYVFSLERVETLFPVNYIVNRFKIFGGRFFALHICRVTNQDCGYGWELWEMGVFHNLHYICDCDNNAFYKKMMRLWFKEEENETFTKIIVKDPQQLRLIQLW